jgi:hypothetical protein
MRKRDPQSSFHREISGDSELVIWDEPDGSFTMLSTPRMATAREISHALAKIPGAVIGTFQGVNFIEGK